MALPELPSLIERREQRPGMLRHPFVSGPLRGEELHVAAEVANDVGKSRGCPIIEALASQGR